MKTYFDFPTTDGTAISVIPFTGKDSVIPHCHSYYEFALITRGSCKHTFKGVTTLLVPGDVFLIPPHQVHSYELQSEVTIINCHFYPEKMGADWNKMLETVTSDANISSGSENIKYQWDSLLQYVTLIESPTDSSASITDQEIQGILHLNSLEASHVESLLNSMVDEQTKKDMGVEYVKAAYLQVILVIFNRVQIKKYTQLCNYSDRKRELIYDAISYIEAHLDEDISFSQIAQNVNLSPSYFRAIFKDVTGLTPIAYLNRMRIVKSLEYLEYEGLSIADAAGKVGIYDANYYSRLFKKVMGYSPRYFKKIN